MSSTSDRPSANDLRKEYALDYAASKPNRFAATLKNTTMVVLQPDVAEVFTSSEAVNELLRSAIVATGAKAKKARQSRSRSS